MNQGIVSYAFPACFPPDFVSSILPKDLKHQKLQVYRVCTNGAINKDSFLSSYEEYIRGIKPKPHNLEKRLKDPAFYSTSCNCSEDGIRQALVCLTDHHPEAFVALGVADSVFGPVQMTIDRVPNYRNIGHVDWWLFADSDPSPGFSKCDIA